MPPFGKGGPPAWLRAGKGGFSEKEQFTLVKLTLTLPCGLSMFPGKSTTQAEG